MAKKNLVEKLVQKVPRLSEEQFTAKIQELVELAFYQGQSTLGDKQPVTPQEFKEMFGFLPKYGFSD
jgi:hypothetical protein